MSTAYATISDAAAARHRLASELANHLQSSKKEEARLRQELEHAHAAVRVGSAGLDLAAIALAESILEVRGQYEKAGSDRAGVLRDAVAEIATGEKQGYRGLWVESFGTKAYAHWYGQRCDCQYGMGPSHGSLIFTVGLRREVRERMPRELTQAERDACVYYLENLQAIQARRAQSEVAA